eukprot:scaffold27400_cov140-Isochrysis_galbana.AAC.6
MKVCNMLGTHGMMVGCFASSSRVCTPELNFIRAVLGLGLGLGLVRVRWMKALIWRPAHGSNERRQTGY